MKRTFVLVLGLAALAPSCSTADPNLLPIGDPGDPVTPSFPVDPPTQPRPTNMPPVQADVVPPPISGGTLLIAHDGTTAIASDPDRDSVYIVDLASEKLVRTVGLQPGDEPGRLIEDSDRRVHVALRGGAALATIDLDSGALIDRRSVCGAPRGVAHDSARGLLHVACATGELWTLPADGGPATRRLFLGPNLRDVIVEGDRIYVSRFKGAQVLQLAVSGDNVSVERTMTPPEFVGDGIDANGNFSLIHATPTTGWRTLALPSGGVVMAHARGVTDPLSTKMGGYGGGPCKGSGVASSTVTILDGNAHPAAGALMFTALPVDLALSKDGTQVALVDAGANPMNFMGFGNLISGPLSNFSNDKCAFLSNTQTLSGQLTAVAFDGQDRIIAQSREPAALFIAGTGKMISLSSVSRRDTGHDLFHSGTAAGIACASCHPEAGEDGHVWNFESTGPRRTQAIRGGFLGTEPFHWSGDMEDFTHLTTEVMTNRMMGPLLTATEVNLLSRWIDSQPQLPSIPVQDAEAVKRGSALFNDSQVGCTSCHSGAKLTSNSSVDVGTGGQFQVPSLLGVGYRAPFLHTGCAPTLRDRFGTCGGGDGHGSTSQLSAAQLDDLTAYLNTL